VYLLVSKIMQKLLYQFHKIQWKGDTLATEEKLDFGDDTDKVTLGL